MQDLNDIRRLIGDSDFSDSEVQAIDETCRQFAEVMCEAVESALKVEDEKTKSLKGEGSHDIP